MDQTWQNEFTFRPISQDSVVLAEVLFGNEYGLLDPLDRETVIIDVGAHIGCFAVAALMRGVGKIICYEPDAGNFNLLRKNVSPWDEPFGRVEIHNEAVFVRRCKIPFKRMTNNTAMGHAGQPKDPLVQCESLDEILKRFDQVTLLKMDCEGCEWPMLMHSTELKRCSEIVCELHTTGHDDPRTQLVVDHLTKQGFEATATPMPNHQRAMQLRAINGG